MMTNDLQPGDLITLQPSHPIGEGLNLLVLETEYPQVRWIKRNTIGLYIKDVNKNVVNRAICLFGEELFEVALSCIQPYKEE